MKPTEVATGVNRKLDIGVNLVMLRWRGLGAANWAGVFGVTDSELIICIELVLQVATGPGKKRIYNSFCTVSCA